MAKETKTKNKKRIQKVKQQVGRTAFQIFVGESISSSFFGRNKFTVLIAIGLIMLYITFKYECQTRMETIAKLETELSIIKSESIRERSTYKSSTRESTMRQRIEKLRIPLEVQSQPPYVLHYDD